MMYKKIALFGLIVAMAVSHTTHGMNKQESRKQLIELSVFAGGFAIGMVAMHMLQGLFESKKTGTDLEQKKDTSNDVTNKNSGACTSEQCKKEKEELQGELNFFRENIHRIIFNNGTTCGRISDFVDKYPFWRNYEVSKMESTEIKKFDDMSLWQIKIKEQK